MIDIQPGEYALFRTNLPLDRRLPPEYEAWRAANERASRSHRAAGYETQPVTVSYVEFLRYAKGLDQSPTYSVLVEYAIGLAISAR